MCKGRVPFFSVTYTLSHCGLEMVVLPESDRTLGSEPPQSSCAKAAVQATGRGRSWRGHLDSSLKTGRTPIVCHVATAFRRQSVRVPGWQLYVRCVCVKQ